MLRIFSKIRPASLEDLLDTKLLAHLDAELGMPANYSGLRMTDGRVLPPYDWVAESVPTHQAELQSEVNH